MYDSECFSNLVCTLNLCKLRESNQCGNIQTGSWCQWRTGFVFVCFVPLLFFQQRKKEYFPSQLYQSLIGNWGITTMFHEANELNQRQNQRLYDSLNPSFFAQFEVDISGKGTNEDKYFVFKDWYTMYPPPFLQTARVNFLQGSNILVSQVFVFL